MHSSEFQRVFHMHLIFLSLASLSHQPSNEHLLTFDMTETDVVLSDVGVCCGVSLFETAEVMGKWPFFSSSGPDR